MSEDVFRWVITAGVALSWLMTVVTAGGMLALYRTSKRMEDKVGTLLEKVGPILDSARSIVNDARPKIELMIVQASEMTASAREQVARLDGLHKPTLHPAIDDPGFRLDPGSHLILEVIAGVRCSVQDLARENL